ncbi:MAG: hypothetical protein LBH25_08790 [Fibromonadaceae bacterium]|jgi:hypothetical protein|nr:hypothetical protein [Fibromonadaceae bacterium]
MNKMKVAIFAISAAAFLLGCSKDDIADTLAGRDGINCQFGSGLCYKMSAEQCSDNQGNKVEQCKNSGGDSVSVGGTVGKDGRFCTLNGKQAFCQYPTGCYNLDSEYEGRPCEDMVANCAIYGQVFTGIDGSKINESNSWGEGLKCSNLGGSSSNGSGNNASGVSGDGEEFCKYNGKALFCQWEPFGSDPGGCYKESSIYNPDGKTCTELYNACKAYGKPFFDVDGSLLTEENGYGKGLKCSNLGGNNGGGNNTSGVSGDDGDYCKYNGKMFFCQWEPWAGDPGGCYAHSFKYGPENGTCQEQYNRCKADGKIFFDVDNSLLTEANGYGKELRCSNLGGSQAN